MVKVDVFYAIESSMSQIEIEKYAFNSWQIGRNKDVRLDLHVATSTTRKNYMR